MLAWMRFGCLVVMALAVASATGSAGAKSVEMAGGALGERVAVGALTVGPAQRLALLRTVDLSTNSGAWHYLRAIGLDPRKVVIQHGRKNYAGPSCPGNGWTCTTARHVLQVGAANVYSCSPRTSGSSPDTCVIVQSGGGTATCLETNTANGVTQNCSITQTNTASSANNNAVVGQVLAQTGGQAGVQTATQNATIAQQNTLGGSNNAAVTQNVIQLLGRGAAALNDDANNADDFTPSTNSAITQKQDAYQRLWVKQETSNGTSPAGNNTAGILQTQAQRARADHAPSITQLQNTAPLDGSATCPTLSPLDDKFANQCNTVQQSSSLAPNTGGKNKAVVAQDYRQFQAASNCCSTQGTQVQGIAGVGGLDHRFAHASSGLSTQNSNQNERLVQRRSAIVAPGLAAFSNGPTRKGTGTQTGNPGDAATQTQKSVQISTPAIGATLTNLVSDHCFSQGNCTGTQDVDSNGDVTHNTQSGSTINIAVTCTPPSPCIPTSTAPPEGSVVVPAGGSAEVQRTFSVPAKPASADIEIAIDTTGSMGASIAQAKADAAAIVNGVKLQVPDSQFAVVQFRDAGDAPEYAVARSMTSDAAAIQTALDSLAAGGGGDAPEGYNRVFHNSYTPTTGGDIGWRAGTRKFVVVIGDAQPHGALAGTFPGCADVTADAFNTATELGGMNTNQRTLFMIRQASTASTSLACYQSLAAAAFTGGQGVDSGTSLASQIVALINSAFTTVSNVHLEVASATPAPAAASWVSFSPTAVGPVTPPLDELFTVTINVPAATAPGTYTFDIAGLADGADIGHKSVVVFVP